MAEEQREVSLKYKEKLARFLEEHERHCTPYSEREKYVLDHFAFWLDVIDKEEKRTYHGPKGLFQKLKF